MPNVTDIRLLNFSHLVFNICLLGLVEMNLDQPCAVELDADSLADDFRRKAQVLEDRIVHRGQSAAKNRSHTH